MKVSLVSVVVIGRNEGERLRRCLESVCAMERGDWVVEVIYVDSGSADGSLGVAEEYGARVIALRPERPTAALARNAGWRVAGGEVVFFLDGDTVVSPLFVRESLGEFEDERVGVVWGHRREMYPERSVYNRVMDLDWVYIAGFTGFCGGDALFRREVLERTGGFDETLIAGEEPELCRRVIACKWVILHVDRAMTGHDLGILSLVGYWRRAVRAGHAYVEVSERFRGTGEPFWEDEVRRNRTRALGWMTLIAACFVVSFVVKSLLPMVFLLGFSALLVVRTAFKARWKGAGWGTLLLYGVHSQFQQIPIYFGQREFWRNKRRGFATGLVEYKRG